MADQLARGFLIGATAGRTTLTGEGLQHADGHSHLLASTNPAVVSYDPAYGYEIGHIIRAGIERMYGGHHPDPNVMYYLTVYNEPIVQPAEPEGVDVDGIVRGVYKLRAGEGLQHADGHSPLLASTNPAVITYDPAYGYEIGHIMRDGLERMYGGNHPDPNVMYYLTVYNEPILQPAEPEDLDVEGLLKGIYLLAPATIDGPRTQLLASGVSVPWALEAQQILADEWGVSADVWSVTSWNELRRDGLDAAAESFMNPGSEARVPYVTQKLAGATGPVVAVTDYMKAVPDQIRQFVPNEFATLGADGFGFSDTRAAARRFFKIDAHCVVVQALEMLGRRGEVDADAAQKAFAKYRIDEVNAGTSGTVGGDA
jgi:pyruvate dehydrogenase E1 component